MNMPLKVAVPKAQLQCFKPSAQQEKVARDGLAFLQMTNPFWSSILYGRLPLRYTHDVPLLATDAHYVYVNPDGLTQAGFSIENVAFGEAHEVGHYILNHLVIAHVYKNDGEVVCPSGPLPYVHQIANMAMDYVINAMLIDGKVGEFPKCGLYDPAMSEKGMESWQEVYEKVWNKMQQQSGGKPGQQQGQGGSGAGDGHGGFDRHLEPSSETVEAEERSGAMIRAQAIASAKMVADAAGIGTMPAALRQLIGNLLEPTVRWEDHLRSAMTRAAGEPRNNWGAVNKRLISRPDPWGKIGFARRDDYGCGQVVVMYDTSGSCINEKTQTKFFSEMAGIVADLNPAELIVIWCDAEVQRIDRLEEPTDLESLRMEINDLGGAPGGGGTDFRPPFKWVRDEFIEPDMVVYLTDTYGVFPEETPDYPVIWCSLIENPRVPFGEVVEIKEN